MVTQPALLAPPSTPASTPVTPDTSESPRLWERALSPPNPQSQSPPWRRLPLGLHRAVALTRRGLSPQSDSARPRGTQVPNTRDAVAMAEQQAPSRPRGGRGQVLERGSSLGKEAPVPGTHGPICKWGGPSLAPPYPSPSPEPRGGCSWDTGRAHGDGEAASRPGQPPEALCLGRPWVVARQDLPPLRPAEAGEPSPSPRRSTHSSTVKQTRRLRRPAARCRCRASRPRKGTADLSLQVKARPASRGLSSGRRSACQCR